MSNTKEWANRMNKDSNGSKYWEYQKELEKKLEAFINDNTTPSITITPLEGTVFTTKELLMIREMCRSLNIKFNETDSHFILGKQKIRR